MCLVTTVSVVYGRQMDQMRSELMQERSVRQDLECDKMSLERQVLTTETGTDP